MTTTPRLTSTLIALAAVPLLVVGLAACSSGDGAAGSPGVKSDSQVEDDALAWDVANASCLRSEGLDVEDPGADDGMRAPLTGDMDAVMAAAEKCEEKTNDDLGPRPVTSSEKKSSKEREAEMRETAKCLREKGYEVPDPAADGSADAGGEVLPADVLEECGGAVGGSSVVER
jgi:hypothetical protein